MMTTNKCKVLVAGTAICPPRPLLFFPQWRLVAGGGCPAGAFPDSLPTTWVHVTNAN